MRKITPSPLDPGASRRGRVLAAVLAVLLPALGLGGCARPGSEVRRRGDEIMVCGRLFHTGAPVVLWTDPGGYDAYRTEKRFVPWDRAAWTAPTDLAPGSGPATPARFGTRFGRDWDASGLSEDDRERVRGGGWDLPTLRRVVDQFVLHYDACGTSRQCFRTLHDARGLSVHFMLDLDGTIYQTLDVKERAWHATTSNDRSIGVEIANIGAYPQGSPGPLAAWYGPDGSGGTRITIPPVQGDGGIRTPGFVGRPARAAPVSGEIHGKPLRQYDLTAPQYDSLVKLTATLCAVFPNLPCDYPRDDRGLLITTTLSPESLSTYRGLLGHYHVQADKVDPGPALQWDTLVAGARRRMRDAPPVR